MAQMKRVVRRWLRRAGWNVRRSGPGRFADLGHFLASRGVEVVFDVGANLGQFGHDLRDLGYRGRIVSFEPIAEIFAALKRVADRDGNWEAHHLALGAAPGQAEINVSQESVFSSFLGQTQAARQCDPLAAVMRRETVDVARFDDCFARFRGKTCFLKIDTQGFERQVLEGAAQALTVLAGVQIEAPVVPLYDGTWSLEEAIAYLRAAGFILSQVHPVKATIPLDPVSLVEVDCVFRRRAADGS